MRIKCDVCGAPTTKEDALLICHEDGVYSFCSSECAAECGYRDTVSDPSWEEDDAAASDLR